MPHGKKAHALEKMPIKDKTKLEIRQSPTPHLPRTPLRLLACAASFSGGTTTVASMILDKAKYRGVWDSIFIFSQSVDHDGTWNEVKKYVRQEIGKDPKVHFFSEWDGEAIRTIALASTRPSPRLFTPPPPVTPSPPPCVAPSVTAPLVPRDLHGMRVLRALLRCALHHVRLICNDL